MATTIPLEFIAPQEGVAGPAIFSELGERYLEAARLDPLIAPHAEAVFEQRAVLGEGGMGRVLRVLDRRLNREAALKILKPGTESPEAVLRFLREAHITARLNHPSIPSVLEAGRTAAGVRYMLLGLTEGQTLEDRIAALHRDGPPPLDDLREVLLSLVRVAETVAYAHGRSVVHRDLKPSNIILGSFGEVMVMDWGLARSLDDPAEETGAALPWNGQSADDLTEPGVVLGTPGYMSPEQSVGGEVGPRSDVFALGAILVKALSGRLPVPGADRRERVRLGALGQIEDPASLRPDLPSDLVTFLRGSLSADPQDRPTALTFARGLRAFLDGQAIPRVRYRLRRRLAILAGRNGRRLLALSLIFGLGIATAIQTGRLNEAESSNRRLSETARGLQGELTEARRGAESRASMAKDARRDRSELRLARRMLSAGGGAALIAARLRGAAERFSSEETLLDAAALASELGELDESARYLDRALERSPDFAEALWYRHVLEKQRRHRSRFGSTIFLDRLAALGAAGGYHGALARACQKLALGRPQEALNDIESAAQMRELGGLEEALAGAALAKLGEVGRAMERFRRAESLEPAPEIFLERAALWEGQGDYARALAEAEAGLARDGENPWLWNNKGVFLEHSDRPAEALLAFDQALALEPDNALFHANRASALLGIGELQQAAEELELALRLDPELAPTYNVRGLLYESTMRLREALADYSRAIELDPERPAFYRRRSDLFRKLNDIQRALLDLDKAVALKPTARSLGVRADMKRRLGDLRGALADYRRALEMAGAEDRSRLETAIEKTETELGEER